MTFTTFSSESYLLYFIVSKTYKCELGEFTFIGLGFIQKLMMPQSTQQLIKLNLQIYLHTLFNYKKNIGDQIYTLIY
ncbi:unnamed protein product [Paramecium pentaurelia]|uniref:Uncharacterized protein n=1 Tax=Paramecium pentaurelia TaxID=43138 RepID=A0A8S1VFZ4_9CILI|nr:unnamed protein product [Paramecium pentaurelia]